MRRRDIFKAIGAMLFGGGIAKAADKRVVIPVKLKLAGIPEFEAMLQKKIDEAKAESAGYKAWKESLAIASSDPKRQEWKLCRAIYDYDGLSYVEGNTMDADHFEGDIAEDRLSWVIARPVPWDGGTCMIVELEGEKENLEYVLDMIKGHGAGVNS